MIVPHKMRVDYGEISVFDMAYSAPCHDWTESEVNQTFCWNGTQVAFLTLLYSGVMEVTVQIEEELSVRPDAVRAIQVPFLIVEDAQLSVWHSPNSWFDIPTGEYGLLYQTGFTRVAYSGSESDVDKEISWNEMWCSLTFVRQSLVEAKVLRQDEKMSSPASIITTNKPSEMLVRLSDPQYADRFYADNYGIFDRGET